MKNLLTLSIFALLSLATPVTVFGAIDVDFESTPLFGISNFLPGDTEMKTVTVTNTGTETEDVYTELLNVVDGGLSSMVDVVISSGGTLFSGSFSAFDSAGKVPLTSLGAGDTITYTYAMSFRSQAGNPFQNTSLGFDLCIGFSGGQFECDDMPNGYSQGSYNGYSQGSYGGNGYSQGSYGGGNGERISLQDRDGDVAGDSSSNDDRPVPQIAGEQVSVIPIGAPNTGEGYVAYTAGALFASLLLIVGIVLSTLRIRRMTHDRK